MSTKADKVCRYRDGNGNIAEFEIRGVLDAATCREWQGRSVDPDSERPQRISAITLRQQLSTPARSIRRAHSRKPLCWKGSQHPIGSVAYAYASALAETTIGLFKTEAVGRGSPFLTGPMRTIDDVEYATMGWIDWFNNRRLHSQLDLVPPEEYEAAYYAHTPRRPSRRRLDHEAGMKAGTVQFEGGVTVTESPNLALPDRILRGAS